MLERMQFAGTWRDYQARVLEEFESHLGDDRLHVVAASGAGKTILGLEIVRRLDRPALVFSPSLAIRNQWRERLCPLFMPDLPGTGEISRDLADPRVLTLSTYQSLDSYRRGDAFDALIEGLNSAGPLTLVLDEAHHLRKAWWECLDRLANELEDVRIVALTATPPYDASHAEWRRYERLCGPIDLEIGIPELVRNGDLCPHQDHLILSHPSADALELLERRRRTIADLQADLRNDGALLDWLETHAWLTNPEGNIAHILNAPEMLSAVLVLLGSAERELPRPALDLLGAKAKHLPAPSQFWLEILLDGLVFRHTKTFALAPDTRRTLENRLQRGGLIEGKRVRLRHTRSVFRRMASSLEKLKSIAAIARAEQETLGDDLRMVVLTDHVRAGELPRAPEAPFEPAKLGVIPIFESLRRGGVIPDRLAVLSGNLVIVPAAALDVLDEVCHLLGIAPDEIRSQAMDSCPDHVKLSSSAGSSDLVRLVTALFMRGDVRIVVGTQSLLGQGWDAPALNSLVLASNTASFMLSNQMRGRAIRIDPEAREKVANIWHLATIEPGASDSLEATAQSLDWGALDDTGPAAFSDIGIVERRFRAFEGISNGSSDLIESGLGRLALDPGLELDEQNAVTLGLARDRGSIAGKWRSSLGKGTQRSQVRETASPNYAPRALSWSHTLQSLVWTAGGSGGFVLAEQLSGVPSLEMLGFAAMGASGIAVLASLPRLARATQLMWRNGSLESSLEQVARAVLVGLAASGLIGREEAAAAQISVRSSADGRKDVVVANVSRQAERLVMEAIIELLGPVRNPRYLLVRQSWLGLFERADYHAVPTVLGTRKEHAEAFARIWRKRVGPSKLVFTRQVDGRKVLLRARIKSFAAGFQRTVDRRSAWL